MPKSTPLIAMSRSASANTMVGDFPPSSSVTGMSLSAATRAIARPVSVPPVNEILPHAGMRDERGAGDRARAGHDAEQAGGQAGRLRDAAEFERDAAASTSEGLSTTA